MKNIKIFIYTIILMVCSVASTQGIDSKKKIFDDDGYDDGYIAFVNNDQYYYRISFFLEGELYIQQLIPPSLEKHIGVKYETDNYPFLLNIPMRVWGKDENVTVSILNQRFDLKKLSGEYHYKISISSGKVEIKKVPRLKLVNILKKYLPVKTQNK